ncbi:DUF1990 family protein [Trujillonella endophytica]|uniref:Uncharacterized protein, UPF0548 family n=1 Tax=Trujillonella endophytica TaxID=673521 RepID=A0A1H8SE41_9ACTN|nr:DUF1990 domain-containing protein [Trujillella endophytica]SEO76825.1 Uncharacterized protein, UPF0548 family [Trujillella endophytica]
MGLLRAVTPAGLADVPFTYPEVGATADPVLPAGYRHSEHTVVVGGGRDVFDRVVAAVFAWRVQRSVGLRVRASGPPTEPGTVVVLTAGLDRLGYDIPCRVVWARTAGDEQGFAYGTLPGHPESGEEAFLVRIAASGEVTVRLRVFSRLASPSARLAGPLAWRVQALATRRYLAALRRAARS